MRLRALAATGLVLVQYLAPRGPYRIGHVGGVPPAEAAAGLAEGIFAEFPLASGVETLDVEIGPSICGRSPSEDVTEPDPERARRAAILIPDGWRDLHHLRRVKLAKEIAGRPDISKADDADAIIAAELEERGR